MTQTLRLREGVGGQFGNMIVTNVGNHGVKNDQCVLPQLRTQQTGIAATANWATAFNQGNAAYNSPNYLWFSSNNIIYSPLSGFGSSNGFDVDSSCQSNALSVARFTNPMLTLIPSYAEFNSSVSTMIDPRPIPGGAAFQNVDACPSDTWFTQTNYKGAFSRCVSLSVDTFMTLA